MPKVEQLPDISRILIDALGNASEAFVVYDKDGCITVCNKNFRELYGYTEDEAKPGVHFSELARLDIANGNVPIGSEVDKVENFIEGRFEFTYDPAGTLEIPFIDGRWISISERPISDGGIISIQRDITDRKKMEDELRKTGELFRAAFNASESSCSITELDTGKFLDVNANWSKVTGYSRDDAIGRTSVDLAIWRNNEARLQLVSQIQKNPSIRGFETQIRKKNGDIRDVVLSSEIILFGGVKCLFLSTLDLTEARRVEEARKESERRFRAIFENAQIGMALYDGSTNKMIVGNQKYLETVGLSDAGGWEFDWKENIHSDDVTQDLMALERLKLGEVQNYQLEKRYVQPDGSVRWVESSVTRMNDLGNGPGQQILVMLTDITQKKDAELALQLSRERFFDFTRSTMDWYWEMDENNRFTFVSPVIAQSLGYTGLDYIGRAYNEITENNPEKQDSLDALYKSLDEREEFRDVVLYRRHKETGEKVWLRTSGQPVHDTEGVFVGYRGATADITDQIELEEKLQQSQKMEAVGQLTGGIAHDFNNLLAVIMGNVELIEEALEEGQEVNNSLLQSVVRAAERGAELTQSMLAFSRKQDLSPTLIRLDERIESMVGMLKRALGETVYIETRFADDLWYCKADAGKVENALLNLGINARDAMPLGGNLLISADNIVLDDAYVATQPDVKPGKYVVLSVTDTGSGISPEQLSHVCEPFFTTKEIGKGTGLGLSMIYGFARQSRGHLAISSELGVGTTVKLFLPFAEK